MNVVSKRAELSGHIQVPGSKSHTIRALLFASLAEGTSHIRNPLGGADCVSSSRAVPALDARSISTLLMSKSALAYPMAQRILPLLAM